MQAKFASALYVLLCSLQYSPPGHSPLVLIEFVLQTLKLCRSAASVSEKEAIEKVITSPTSLFPSFEASEVCPVIVGIASVSVKEIVSFAVPFSVPSLGVNLT